MIMIPKAKDDLTIDQKLDQLNSNWLNLHTKLDYLEEQIEFITDSIKGIDLVMQAMSIHLLREHEKYEKEQAEGIE